MGHLWTWLRGLDWSAALVALLAAPVALVVLRLWGEAFGIVKVKGVDEGVDRIPGDW